VVNTISSSGIEKGRLFFFNLNTSVFGVICLKGCGRSRVWSYTAIIPAIQEAETGGLPAIEASLGKSYLKKKARCGGIHQWFQLLRRWKIVV
jgi:hypothetical protein